MKIQKFNNQKHDLCVYFCESKQGILGLNPKKAESLAVPKQDDFKSAKLFLNTGFDDAKHSLTLGLGDLAERTAEDFRRLGGVASKKLSGSTTLSLHADRKIKNVDHIQAFLEGLLVGLYKWNEQKSKKKPTTLKTVFIDTHLDTKEVKELADRALAVADAINLARRLGDSPGNLMTPVHMAKEAQKLASAKLKVTVWNKARILKEKMGGLYSVALGSSQEPRFIRMDYKGGSAKQKPICLVGKGLTFDAGGISIKPSAGMHDMKYDMCGGSAVIAAMSLISKMKLKVNVIGLVPSSENLLGASANKPGDIVKFRNGKTAEILNTDAEGRLILADALSYASELKPAAIFDAATLTGAMVVSLGNSFTGYFTRDESMAKKVEKTSPLSGENVWRMPITDEHVDDIKGTYADIQNIGATRGAGSSTACAFLEQFVDEKIPYVHFDIAGTAWHCGKRREYLPAQGATGVLVRTFLQIAKSYEA